MGRYSTYQTSYIVNPNLHSYNTHTHTHPYINHHTKGKKSTNKQSVIDINLNLPISLHPHNPPTKVTKSKKIHTYITPIVASAPLKCFSVVTFKSILLVGNTTIQIEFKFQ